MNGWTQERRQRRSGAGNRESRATGAKTTEAKARSARTRGRVGIGRCKGAWRRPFGSNGHHWTNGLVTSFDEGLTFLLILK
jgi:hypothetical protein